MLKGKKILYFEDDTFVARVYEQSFIRHGLQVLHYNNAPESADKLLELVYKEKPDLIISDLVHKNLDGFAILQAVRENQEAKDLPIIFLTNITDESKIAKAKELGVSEYLIRAHYIPDELIGVLVKYLD